MKNLTHRTHSDRASTASDVIERALQSEGASSEVIYSAAAEALRRRAARGVLVDVGCGNGCFRDFVRDLATGYIGVDVVRHRRLSPDVTFLQADLDAAPVPVPSGSAAIVAAIETIEHIENPRALVRELVRVAQPGGWIVVTTPNQASVLSLLAVLATGQFAAFRGSSYPAHRTALLPVDLERMAAECGLRDPEIAYSHRGRIPLSAVHYPRAVSRLFPRAFSDNVLFVARKDG